MMTKCELMLCRLSCGETIPKAMKIEGVSAVEFNRWLNSSENRRAFQATMKLRQEVLDMRAGKIV